MSSDTYRQITALLPSLSPEEQERLQRWLERNPSISLSDLVQIKENQGIACPECGSVKHLVKYGKTESGVQRYRCKKCEITFTPLSYTFLSNSKKSLSTWLSYLDCMINGFSLNKSAEICGISSRTAFFWRHKILDILRKKLKRIKLRGIIEADDTFFRESYKGNSPPDREPYRRGTPASKRGISEEQIAVSTAVDRNGKVYGRISAKGRSTAKEIKKAIGSRIDKEAILCTDNDSAYRRFANDKHLEHIVIQEHETVKGVYHVNNINSYHSRLKSFIKRFKGVATKYLDNYLAWLNSIGEMKLCLCQVLKAAIKEDWFGTWQEIKSKPLMPV